MAADAPVCTCYEAGRDGFWLHRALTKLGITNLVVDASSIEVNRRQKQIKSDPVDAAKLVSMLCRYHAGERKVWSVVNVPSWREAAGVSLDVPGYGRVTGDVAWGGNWFYLVGGHGEGLTRANAPRLVAFTTAIRAALEAAGVTGRGGAVIEHVELVGPPLDPANGGRNFVLCPGGAYDRSPCGTGTSAKLACLAADGLLAPGEVWRQEGVLGTVFEGTYEWEGPRIRPTVTGRAYVTAEATLLLDPADPFAWGI